MTDGRIRILIVDDHPIVLKGLAASIGAEPDMTVVASARTAREAIDAFRLHQPDVTIMDVSLTPQMTGIEAAAAIRQEFPKARIIMLSAHKGDDDIFRALKAGAATYLLKDSLGDELVAVIRDVHAGGNPLPGEVGMKLAERVRQPSLTAREIEVLHLVAQGLRNKDIAIALYISEDTVQEHVQKILFKLDAASRTEAVAIAARRGIVRFD